MAELIGVMASGAGLLALSIQMGECALKLKTFYDRMKNAPSLLLDLSHELETIALILQGLEKHRRDDSHDTALLQRCILRCEEKVTEIQVLIDQLETRNSSLSRLGKIHTAFKDESIEKMLMHLERAKSSIMARQSTHNERQALSSENLSRILAAHSMQLGRLEEGSAMQTSFLQRSQQTLVSKSDLQHQDVHIVFDDEDSAARAALQNYRKIPWRKKIFIQSQNYRARISLPFGLSSKVWDLAAGRAASGWNLSIRSYNCRPRGSEVFVYCENGDLQGVQRLMASGEASPLDCDPKGQTLLEKAAHFHQLQICRLLLAEAGPLDVSLSRMLLSWTTTGGPKLVDKSTANLYSRYERQEALYRLIIEEYGADVDFEDVFLEQKIWGATINWRADRFFWLSNFSSTKCIDLLKRHQDHEWSSQPDEIRIEKTLRIMGFRPYWPINLFLRWLDLEKPTRNLALFKDSNGDTVLHYAASWLAWKLSNGKPGDADVVEVEAFCLALLRLGSDPLATCTSGLTPLMTALFSENTNRYGRMPIKLYLLIVRRWVLMLDEIRMNTNTYRETEWQLWHNSSISSNPKGDEGVLIQRPSFHLSAALCSFEIRRAARIPTYKLRTPPGRWLAPDHQIAEVCWEPDGADWDEGYWALNSSTLTTSKLLDAHEELSEIQLWGNHYFAELIQDSQDDAGIIALRIPSIGLGLESRRRSSSQPPALYRRQLAYHRKCDSSELYIRGGYQNWLPSFHLCPLDNRIHFHYDSSYKMALLRDGALHSVLNLRDCMTGTHRRVLDFEESEEWERHSFMGSCPECCDPTLAKELYEAT